MTATGRPLRADARRNREAILGAARELFAERGLDVPLDSIAEAAGVGAATQRRHFPTRASLIQAIFDENIGRMTLMVDRAEDPAHAFEAMLHGVFEAILEDRSLVEIANSRYVLRDVHRQIAAGVLERIEEPLRLAQEAGRVRADLRPDDFFLLIAMLGTVARIDAHDSAIDRIDRGIGLIMEAIAPNPLRPFGHAAAG
ncbi:helix-turn-helix domain-containing protein [Conexibacter stalactiti]|uniref:Helix-turn-helix domain-containing protein n=1 Tax=Conexibacter stalactiti TaxID=1940611 RepID=A0ABU4HIG4_9ACTN|nr:helix-turn-helix domain-containing protein [Conexibacter stalactiti]MDW5593101.1 helix-turn-helix domain-containing protein [Conexibacter stalactiti]MEC5033742.1 helix-turn-helix domain-containing protein [Conexibacter stalactiti]